MYLCSVWASNSPPYSLLQCMNQHTFFLLSLLSLFSSSSSLAAFGFRIRYPIISEEQINIIGTGINRAPRSIHSSAATPFPRIVASFDEDDEESEESEEEEAKVDEVDGVEEEEEEEEPDMVSVCVRVRVNRFRRVENEGAGEG